MDSPESHPDHFSTYADRYARYRPRYPAALFEFLAGVAPRRELAWDVGTGNGQCAIGLAEHFRRVIATDASAAQLAHAMAHARIEYRVALAESCDLAEGGVDLISIAQAIHWFRFDAFYENVRRVARPSAVLAAICYTLPRVDPVIDAVCDRYYRDVTGPYWPPDRRYIDECYATIPFPFDEIAVPRLTGAVDRANPPPSFEGRAEWTRAEYAAYLDTWSAVQRFKQRNGRDPFAEIADELAAAWPDGHARRAVRWPIYMRAGRVV